MAKRKYTVAAINSEGVPGLSLVTTKVPWAAPNWVPNCIKHEAELSRISTWEPPLNSEGEETLHRLLIDERMKRVWKLLFLKKRSEYRQTNLFMHEPIRTPRNSQGLSSWSRQERAAMEYFSQASLYAIAKGPLIPSADLKGIAGLLTEGAKDLRNVARMFHAGFVDNDADDMEDVDHLERIARNLDRHAKNYESQRGLPGAVKRVKGDGELRAFVARLGRVSMSLFGKHLNRTLAATAAVALNRDVREKQVRQILSGG